MKKNLLLPILVLFLSTALIAQKVELPLPESIEYATMKMEGKLPGSVVHNTEAFKKYVDDYPSNSRSEKSAHGCGCHVAPDSSYTLAMAPNDDGSSSIIAIPFTFCLYGTNYNSLYINNNGNISFGSSYGTYSSNPFPDPAYVMVAPFWADVDTRSAGTVKYKITPTAMYVNWEDVGYFNMMSDKLNNFQLIITDGTDPVLPPGNNIAFCYEDMQWTTGSASSGVGGFGGVPSTVGVNKGDGINFIQIGRFDQPGAAYDGGYGANDGVSWLDNQSFYFNSCNSTNIAPIISGLSNCDTINVCATGDTLILNGLFLSPELGQTTTININLGGTPNATIISNTPGNSAIGQVMIVATIANAGNNTITFTATDDGTPVGTSIILVNVFVDTTGISAFNPVISGNLEFCEGQSSTISVSPTTYDSYLWNTGSTNTNITVDSSGLYFVTTKFNECSKTNSVTVTENPLPTPEINGNNFTCGSGLAPIYIDSVNSYQSYVWSTSSLNDSLWVNNGTYTVTVIDSNGCSATSPPFTVINANPDVVISGLQMFCPGDSILLVANPSIPLGANYLWSNGTNTPSTTVYNGGSYTVEVSYANGCSTEDSVFVSLHAVPSANFSISPSSTTEPGEIVYFTDLSTITGSQVAWVWNFGDTLGSSSFVQNPEHIYTFDGNFLITLYVQNINGCWDTIDYRHEVMSELFVPNVFTPNNDGSNDLLIFKNLEYFPATNLTVYNRWGLKIYSKDNYQNDWNGGANEDGVYYYVLDGPALKETRFGFVQILR